MKALFAAIAAAALSLGLSAAYVVERPDLTQSAAFLFGDEAANLFVADALHRGRALYTEVAFPYGPLPIWEWARASLWFGNAPLPYLSVMAVLTALSAAVMAWLIRRCADDLTTIGFIVFGLLPTVPVPGAQIGGYTSSIYMPNERLVLLAVALLWMPAAKRAPGRSLAIGAIAGVCQGIRFGSGAIAVAAIACVDLLGTLRDNHARRFDRSARASALVLAGFAVVECCWMAWAVWTLPRPYALEFLWPLGMWETHQSSGMPRWPTWAGWRAAATQYALPATAAVASIVAVMRWALTPPSRRSDAWRWQGSAIVLLFFFVLAASAYFRHEHHYRQFAWMLLPAAAGSIASVVAPVRLVALVLCAPALWPFVSALSHRPPFEITRLDVPAGYTLYTTDALKARLAFLNQLRGSGPVVFVPNGAGWLYGYGVDHATRHTWFYSAAVVRPFEEQAFAEQLRAARAIVRCDGDVAGTPWPLPPSAAAVIETQFRRGSSREGCTIWKPAALSEGRPVVSGRPGRP